MLRGKGFASVRVLAGGMTAWNQARLPVSRETASQGP
jgi:3-mercaptopyruvate sulfurtransferase SseA